MLISYFHPIVNNSIQDVWCFFSLPVLHASACLDCKIRFSYNDTVTLLDYHISYTNVKVSYVQATSIEKHVSLEIIRQSIIPFHTNQSVFVPSQ